MRTLILLISLILLPVGLLLVGRCLRLLESWATPFKRGPDTRTGFVVAGSRSPPTAGCTSWGSPDCRPHLVRLGGGVGAVPVVPAVN